MSFGKEDTTTTTQETKPWAEAIPALQHILASSRGTFDRGMNFLENRQAAGNPLYDRSASTLSDIISGNTLADITSSPAWGSLKGGVQDAVNSQFSLANRTGSPAHAGVMTSELGKLAGNLWGQERGRQMQAIGMAPGIYHFGNAGLDDIWQNLQRYGSIAQGIGGMGGTGTNTETIRDNTSLNDFLSILAGAAGAYAGMSK